MSITGSRRAPQLSKLDFRTTSDAETSPSHESTMNSSVTETSRIDSPKEIRSPISPLLLSEWPATAIAGNDLLSSILYTIGLCSAVSGRWMPVALLVVSFGILYPFRKIYSEIAQAIPVNGGTFSCILKLWEEEQDLEMVLASASATSPSRESPYPDNANANLMKPMHKQRWKSISAGVVGTLSLLSYISTAVVSAASAIAYGAGEFSLSSDHSFYLTIFVLIVFGMITLAGLKESSAVALVIFSVHCVMFGVLIVSGLLYAMVDQGLSLWIDNFMLSDSVALDLGVGLGNSFKNLYFGICAALLGITGFETSSNYIEEQAPGVFPKTLNNMWLLVTIINPLIGLVTMGTIKLEEFTLYRDNLLSIVAEKSAGKYFRLLIVADAVLALSGGALTAYVGVNGLVIRMAEENMLPKWMLSRNAVTGSHHFIIISFMLLACSLVVITGGKIESLGAVYTVSFLGVLLIAIVGCVILRKKARTKMFTWDIVSALVGVCGGIIGQVILHPENFSYFAQYFTVVFGFVVFMLWKRNSL